VSTQVEICNLALSHIRAKNRIMAFDERSPEASACRAMWTACLNTALAGFDWNFARSFSTLPPAPDGMVTPLYAYAYLYPPDCLRLRRVIPVEGDTFKVKWTIYKRPDSAGKIIGCNYDTPTAIYTQRTTDISGCDDEFTMAMSAYLAYLISAPLTGDIKIGQRALDMFRDSIDTAGVNNGNENGDAEAYGDTVSDASWIEVRK
jgi:hypothetical protein